MVSHHPAKFRGHTNVVVKIWYFVEGQDSARLHLNSPLLFMSRKTMVRQCVSNERRLILVTYLQQQLMEITFKKLRIFWQRILFWQPQNLSIYIELFEAAKYQSGELISRLCISKIW